MIPVAVAPIVEGHGEVEAVRILLSRVVATFELQCFLDVLKPSRVSRPEVLGDEKEMMRAVELAALKLSTATAERKFVLLLLDADQELPCELAPRLRSIVEHHRADVDVACVLPATEYESWLVSGADSLGPFLTDDAVEHIPDDTEAANVGKGWIQRFFAGPKYSETADQARLTALFDVVKARERSRSFAKLCRELEARCPRS